MKLKIEYMLKTMLSILAILTVSLGGSMAVNAGPNDSLKITNQVVTASSIYIQGGTSLTYNVKVSNTGTVDSEPTQLLNLFQITNIKQTNNSGSLIKVENPNITVISNPFIPFSITDRVISSVGVGGIGDAYPINTTITNSARILNLGAIRAGDAVEFNIKVDITGSIPNFCDMSGNGPAMRNITMLINPGTVSNGSMASTNDASKLSLTAVNGSIIPDAIQFNGNTATIASNILYLDKDTNNNFESTDSTYTRFCLPDAKTTLTGDVGIDQLSANTSLITYTLKVKNLGNTQTANNVVTRVNISTCSIFDGFISGLNGTVNSTRIDFNIGNLSPDQEVTSIFKVKPDYVNCPFASDMLLQANATSTISSLQFESDITNNFASFKSTSPNSNVSQSKITGYIFYDADKNTVESKLERGSQYASILDNVEVVAVASNGKSYKGLTDSTGAFSINNLPAGKYILYVNLNSLAKSFNNLPLLVAAMPVTTDGLTREAMVLPNEIYDITSAFRIFTNNIAQAPAPVNLNTSGTTLVLAQDQAKSTQTTTTSVNSSTSTSANNQNTSASTTTSSTTQSNPANSITNTPVNTSSTTSTSNNSSSTTNSTSNSNTPISTPTQDPKVLGASEKTKSEFDAIAGSLIRTGGTQNNNTIFFTFITIFSFAILGLTFYLNNKTDK